MKARRLKREHGRILSVETKVRGDALAEDALAGGTSLVVGDAGDFDEDGGWLVINDQVVEYVDVDDDEGVITLANGLDAAAEEGDDVHVWSTLYEEAVDYQEALVELDGEYDNPEPVVAEVAEGVGDLPEGDRGVAGESCTLLRVSDDEWEVVGVGGRARKSRSIRFEADDDYTLTADDVAAGAVTFDLSHRPIDESLVAFLGGLPQRPTEYTVNYDGPSVTWPLDGWEEAGDVIWVHYAYRKGLKDNTVFSNIEFTSGIDNPLSVPSAAADGDLLVAMVALPTDVSHTALNGYAFIGQTASVTHTWWPDGSTGTYRLAIYARTKPAGSAPVPTFNASANDTPWVLAAFRGRSSIASSVFSTVGDAGAASTPGPADIRVYATIGYQQHITPREGSIAAGANGGSQINIIAVTGAPTGDVYADVPATAGWLLASLVAGE